MSLMIQVKIDLNLLSKFSGENVIGTQRKILLKIYI